MESQSVEDRVHVKSHMHFLERTSFYDQVKPYSMRFPPRSNLPQSNVRREKHDIKFHDIRKHSDLTIDTCGFEVVKAPSKMNYEDFEEKSKIRNIYLREMCEILKAKLEAKHVLALDYSVGPLYKTIASYGSLSLQVRRRHQTFPVSTGKNYINDQPTAMAHIGQ